MLTSDILSDSDDEAYQSAFIGNALMVLQYIVAGYVLYLIWYSYQDQIKALPQEVPKLAKQGWKAAKTRLRLTKWCAIAQKKRRVRQSRNRSRTAALSQRASGERDADRGRGPCLVSELSEKFRKFPAKRGLVGPRHSPHDTISRRCRAVCKQKGPGRRAPTRGERRRS